MKHLARIILAGLLMAGLWLALKPTSGERRLTFLPIAWSQYIDLMDFWFNLTAFALLAAVAWLAISPRQSFWRIAGLLLVSITVGNVLVELAQTQIPGRAMDLADVIAGLVGAVLGIVAGVAAQLYSVKGRPGDMPQVLFVDQTGRLGGAELMLLDIAAARAADSEVLLFQDGEFREALEKARVKTTVLALGDDAAAVDKRAGLLRALRVVPELIERVLQCALKAREFEVVYANTAKALIIGGPAAFLAGRKLVFHLHDIISAGHFSAINRRALVFCANRFASKVIANSEATRQAFINSGGCDERCVVVPNGFHIAESSTSAEEITALRRSLGLPSEAWMILMAGRLTPWKGQHVLLEALPSLPEAHAVLLGDALFTDEDRQYAERLKQLAEAPAVAGRVHFAGFRKDTQRFFDAADVVVHSSVIAEPFGRVIVEGMLAAKPVIATRAGGAAEIIMHGETGLLVEPGDSAALAAALHDLHRDADFAQSLALRGQRAAREAYALDGVRAQIEQIILACGRAHLRPNPLTNLQPAESTP